MRLIDADEVLAALGIFHRHDNDGDSAMHFMNGIETAVEIIEDAPAVEAVPPEVVLQNYVPLKPLARWLAGYAMPPGGLKVHKVVGRSSEDYARLRAESWEYFLRGMDWEVDE